MLTCIYGNLGSGKTLLLTILGYKSKMDVIANFQLKYPYEKFSLQTFLEAKYQNVCLLMDEAYIYLESRDSTLKRNKISSYILFQSRKKNIDMFLTMQLRSTIDIRYRELTNRHIFCEGKEDKFVYTLVDMEKNVKSIFSINHDSARKFFKMYDTNEVIKPPIEAGEFLDKTEQKKLVLEISNQIYLLDNLKKRTKNFIKTYLWDNGYPDYLKDYVYEKVKELQGL